MEQQIYLTPLRPENPSRSIVPLRLHCPTCAVLAPGVFGATGLEHALKNTPLLLALLSIECLSCCEWRSIETEREAYGEPKILGDLQK